MVGSLLNKIGLENGLIQLEDSSTDQLVMESATNSNTNDITKIKITNKGGGYLSLPTVSVTSSSGSSVNLFPVSSSVGRALSTKVLDHGYRYEEAPVLKPKLHIQIDSITGGVPQVGETVSATQEDNIILESFKDETYSLFLEDFRQSKLRLNSEEGDILTEDGDNFVFEENNEPAVFDGAEQDVLITEAGERIIHTIYVDNGETDFMIVTHNGSTDSRLQFETTDAVTGVVESFNGDTNILTLTDQTGSFDDKVTITGGTSGNTARVRVSDPASTVSTAGTVIETDGEYSGVDGHISENTKKIQDSLYYQDYSYVVKVGEAIADWREYLKSAVHPAGFYLAGEVSVVSRIDAKLRSGRLITAGIEQDEIIEAFRVIFGEKIGRRLGTTTDGTSLRASPALGIERDVSFTTNTRDVTLNQDITIKTGDDRETSFRTTNINQGFVYAGARMDTIGKFIFGAFSHVPDRLLIDSSNGSADAGDDLILEDALFNGQIKREPASDTMDSDAATIPRINSIRLTGTGDTSLDGELNQLGDFNTRLGTRYAIPAQINTTR